MASNQPLDNTFMASALRSEDETTVTPCHCASAPWCPLPATFLTTLKATPYPARCSSALALLAKGNLSASFSRSAIHSMRRKPVLRQKTPSKILIFNIGFVESFILSSRLYIGDKITPLIRVAEVSSQSDKAVSQASFSSRLELVRRRLHG